MVKYALICSSPSGNQIYPTGYYPIDRESEIPMV